MSHLFPLPINNFNGFCLGLQRVGLHAGYVLYTNHHASDHQPAVRLLEERHLELAKAYIGEPSDELFRKLVEHGVLLDTEWDRSTAHWQIIGFKGWEVLHDAFSRLYVKARHEFQELTGGSDLESSE